MSSQLKSLLIVALLAAPPAVLAQGLIHARQTIFGMDCAPCAYGIDKGLGKLPGVTSVKVSLNDGYAELTASAGSLLSVAQIREVIRNNGFTPKEARIDLEGTLQLTPDPQLLVGKTSYPLMLPTGTAGVSSGERVSLTGVVATDELRVQVETISPAPLR